MSGFGKSMSRLSESQMREQYNDFEYSRKRLEESLIEKWEKTEGLGLGNGKLAALYEENPRKAAGLALFLENTERHVATLNEYQTSSFLGVTPQEIVKISRIAYPNAVMSDIFNVWGMESVKDTFYKIETKYSSTARGATEGNVTYETFGEGRYPSDIIYDTIAGDGSANYTGTMDTTPIQPFSMKLYLDGVQIAVDDGNGYFVGTGLHASTASTIDYTSGAYDITFATTYDSSHEIIVEGGFSYEDTGNFTQQGSVDLSLVAYDFRARFWNLGVSWHRVAEEIMQSKLGTSARETLIQSAGELMIKSMDELAIYYGKKAANWHVASNPITFDADFATAGADSSKARAQDFLNEALEAAKSLAYNSLGRYADQYSLVCGTSAAAYLTKIDGFQYDTSGNSKVGVHKFGNLGGTSIYKAPSDIAAVNEVYVFGKGTDAMSVDSPVSVGTYRLGMETQTLENQNFQSQKGIGAMADFRINNAKFANKITISNL